MEKVHINLALTSTQMRGCAALVRNISPADIENIACESGEAECIFSALDELQWALAARLRRSPVQTNGSLLPNKS